MILEYKSAKLFYSVHGDGKSIVLLHGFLESSAMWTHLIGTLSAQNKVVCIDLLGHGKSECLGYVHTMVDFAEAVNAVLLHLNITTYKIIGHSLGGYVALALAQINPKISAMCLLNSTFEADDEERKKLRTRANKMVQTNYENMVRMSLANLFSTRSKLKYATEYNEALSIALKTPLQGYMAANEGMKNRKDETLFFTNASFKKYIFLGKKDTILNTENIIKFAKINNIETTVFSEGHMSHIENLPDLKLALKAFILA